MDTSDIAKGIREQFGDEQADTYIAMLKGTKALITVATVYILTDDGSREEALAEDAYNRMLDRLENRPEKSREMIESLLALIVHMRMGGTVQEWFSPAGIRVENILVDGEPR